MYKFIIFVFFFSFAFGLSSIFKEFEELDKETVRSE